MLSKFTALVIETDFIREGKKFDSFAAIDESGRSKVHLLFNAYFVTEQELDSLGLKRSN